MTNTDTSLFFVQMKTVDDSRHYNIYAFIHCWQTETIIAFFSHIQYVCVKYSVCQKPADSRWQLPC